MDLIIVSLADEHSWAPSERPHRTSPSKLHPQQRAGQRPRRGGAGRVRRNITPGNSRCQSASANSIERDHQRFPQITGSSNRRTPRSTGRTRRLPTTDVPNRNHASRKVGKASLPACLNLANTSVKPSFYGASMRCLAARRKQNEPPKLLPRQRVRRAGESPSDRTNLATPDNRCAQSQSRVQQSQQGSCYQLSSISRMRW